MTLRLLRIGGSIGTAVLAVILQLHTRHVAGSESGMPSGLLQPVGPTVRAYVPDPLTTAFAVMTAAAVIVLAVTVTAIRRSRAGGRRGWASG